MKYTDNRMFAVPELFLIYQEKIPAIHRPMITSSKESWELLRKHWGHQMNLIEQVFVLIINSGGRAIGIINIAKGGVAVAAFDLKLIFASALLAKASGIIIAHNHTSGSYTPSRLDIEMTEQVMLAGKLLGIRLIDHLILSPYDEYYSFADNRLVISEPE